MKKNAYKNSIWFLPFSNYIDLNSTIARTKLFLGDKIIFRWNSVTLLSLKHSCLLWIEGWRVRMCSYLFLNAGINVSEHKNECKCIKQKSYYIYYKTPEQALKSLFGIFTLVLLYLTFRDKSVWKTILLDQFQSRSGFKIGKKKVCPFPLKIECSIPKFRDIHSHLLFSVAIFWCCKRPYIILPFMFVHIIFTLLNLDHMRTGYINNNSVVKKKFSNREII